jgi:adenine-specific DNA-methyltransferase
MIILRSIIEDVFKERGSESLRADRPSMWYGIEALMEKLFIIQTDGIEGRWRWKKENVINNRDELEFVKKDDSVGRFYVKTFLDDEIATRPPATLWKHEEVGS